MNDRDIIELYFDRNENAIRETDAKYGRLCRSVSYNILRNHEDTEECINDTYMGAWNAIPPTRPQNLMAFISRIARNLSLKRLEYMKREKRSADVTLSLDELASVLPDERYAPDVRDEAVGELISIFLYGQKEDIRNVFIRRYYFFDSVKDIAERYSFTESKVKNMLLRTRSKLKDYLIKEGIEI